MRLNKKQEAQEDAEKQAKLADEFVKANNGWRMRKSKLKRRKFPDKNGQTVYWYSMSKLRKGRIQGQTKKDGEAVYIACPIDGSQNRGLYLIRCDRAIFDTRK